MALVLTSIYNYYNYYFNDYVGEFSLNFYGTCCIECCSFSLVADARVKGLFLLQSPWPVLAIVGVYLFFVNGNGQNWMKDRKAYEFNSIINVYNITQVLLNLYIGVGVRRLSFLVNPFFTSFTY